MGFTVRKAAHRGGATAGGKRVRAPGYHAPVQRSLAWSDVGARVRSAIDSLRLTRGDLYAFLFFAGITMLWFHELFADIGNSVLVGPNDASYGIRAYWGASHAGENPFTFTRDALNGAPEGMPWSRAVQYANALIPGSIWLLHYPFGFAAASNIYLLLGFVLTGFSSLSPARSPGFPSDRKPLRRLCRGLQPLDDRTCLRRATPGSCMRGSSPCWSGLFCISTAGVRSGPESSWGWRSSPRCTRGRTSECWGRSSASSSWRSSSFRPARGTSGSGSSPSPT